MVDERWQRECGAKERILNEETAIKRLRQMKKKGNRDLHYYFCEFCHFYHIGHFQGTGYKEFGEFKVPP